MKMTRERKIIGLVLGLALAGLGLDRTLLAPPDDALDPGADASALLVSARDRSVSGPITASPPRASPTASSVSGAIESEVGVGGAGEVARRLERIARERALGADAAVVDVFYAAWLDEPAPAVVVAPLSDSARLQAARDAFSKHRLTSILGGGRGGATAMIDGKLLRIGQQFEGYTLVAIHHQAIRLRQDDIDVSLGLQGQLSVRLNNRAAGQPAGTALSGD